jgi:hypothetical protein
MFNASSTDCMYKFISKSDGLGLEQQQKGCTFPLSMIVMGGLLPLTEVATVCRNSVHSIGIIEICAL